VGGERGIDLGSRLHERTAGTTGGAFLPMLRVGTAIRKCGSLLSAFDMSDLPDAIFRLSKRV